MKTLKQILYSLLLLIFCFSISNCKKPIPSDVVVNKTIAIYDSIKHTPELSEFLLMLDMAGLKKHLYVTVGGNFTVFAPTNAAIDSFLKEKRNITSMAQMTGTASDSAFVREIVYSHIIHADLSTLSSTQGRISQQTINNKFLYLLFDDGGIKNIRINSTSKILKADILCFNGMFNIIEKVIDFNDLTPLGKLIEQTGRYTIFTEALKETGYFDSINIVGSQKFTILLESDEVYRANGIHSYQDLRKRFSFDFLVNGVVFHKNPKNPLDSLNKFISSHLLKRENFTNDTSNRSIIPTFNNQIVTFSQDQRAVFVNKYAIKKVKSTIDSIVISSDSINFSVSNQLGANGVYHELTNILKLKYNNQDIIFDLAQAFEKSPNYKTLAEPVNLDSTIKAIRTNGTLLYDPISPSVKDQDMIGVQMPIGSWIEFDVLQFVPKGNYKIYIGMKTSTTYAEFRIYWNGKIPSKTNGGFNPVTTDNVDKASPYYPFINKFGKTDLVYFYKDLYPKITTNVFLEIKIGEISVDSEYGSVIRMENTSKKTGGQLDYIKFRRIN